MSKMNVRQMMLDAMLAAMSAVLAYLSIKVGANFKITFESVPILIGALLFGPMHGALIGFVGSSVYQLLGSGYGVTLTTPLWIAPYVVCGLLVGWYAKRNGFELRQWQLVFIVVLSELAVTLMNTGAIYVDSKLYGWYYPGVVTGVLALRLVVCVTKAVAYSALLPSLLHALRRGAPLRQKGGVA